MTTLTVTARGQVTFRKDVLQHLGIEPGEKIELDKLPDGRVMLRAARPAGKIEGFLGLLAGKTKKVATLDEIDEAAAAGWAGQECSQDHRRSTNILVRAVVWLRRMKDKAFGSVLRQRGAQAVIPPSWKPRYHDADSRERRLEAFANSFGRERALELRIRVYKSATGYSGVRVPANVDTTFLCTDWEPATQI